VSGLGVVAVAASAWLPSASEVDGIGLAARQGLADHTHWEQLALVGQSFPAVDSQSVSGSRLLPLLFVSQELVDLPQQILGGGIWLAE